MHLRLLTHAWLIMAVTACAPPPAAGGPGYPAPSAAASAETLDVERMLEDLSVLAADSMEGRRTGTEGNAMARRYLEGRFAEIGLRAFGDGYRQSFDFTNRQGEELVGHNLIGHIRGTRHPERYLVLTAHYDHLGIRNGQIYNGADDNASGTAGILAIAEWLTRHPPEHSVIIAALDAEEMGLAGARAFVASPPVPLASMALNVNLDMVSRNEHNELYAAGTYHYPFLRPPLERVAVYAPVTLRFGHDSPDLPRGEDWTMQSDHGAFHEVGIPFVYFGVEDHPDYHRPTDTVENIDPDFYGRAVQTILEAVRVLDAHLSAIEREAALSTDAAA
jgi:Zn-dependent M28 family amino/carboxypeptidase